MILTTIFIQVDRLVCPLKNKFGLSIIVSYYVGKISIICTSVCKHLKALCVSVHICVCIVQKPFITQCAASLDVKG